MSRTIRRKKNKKHHSLFEKHYTHRKPDQWFDLSPSWHHNWTEHADGYPLIKLEGKEFEKAWHWYHSDNFNDYEAILRWHGSKESARCQNKQELIKWLQNEEYEPMLLKHLDHSRWYDYY